MTGPQFRAPRQSRACVPPGVATAPPIVVPSSVLATSDCLHHLRSGGSTDHAGCEHFAMLTGGTYDRVPVSYGFVPWGTAGWLSGLPADGGAMTSLPLTES